MANCDVGAHNLDANKAYYYLGSGRRFCKRLNYAGSLKRNFENCLEAMYFREKKILSNNTGRRNIEKNIRRQCIFIITLYYETCKR